MQGWTPIGNQSTPQIETPFIDPSLVANKEVFESIEDIAVCTMCSGLVLNAKQCEKCEYLFCGYCVSLWTQKSKTCPYKCLDFSLKEPSRVVKSILSRVLINCHKNCNQQIKYDDIAAHVKECKGHLVDCPTCGSKVSESLISTPSSYAQLKIENEILKNRVKELENLSKPNFSSKNISVPRDKNFKPKTKIEGKQNLDDEIFSDEIDDMASIDFSKINIDKSIPLIKNPKKILFNKSIIFVHKENSKVSYRFSCCTNEYDCTNCHNQSEPHVYGKILEYQCLSCFFRCKKVKEETCSNCGYHFLESDSIKRAKPVRFINDKEKQNKSKNINSSSASITNNYHKEFRPPSSNKK
jgi:hypothetical protein